VLTDYRFRGISQTLKGPALQGGFDAAHKSGFYVGNWNSNISSVQYNQGPGLEMDFYGGYKGEYKGIGYDVGNLYYYYGDARYAGLPQERYDNNEIYGALSYDAFSAKVSYATTDYFGLNTATNGGLYAGGGKSRGTTYTELNYSKEVMPKVTLIGHVGYTDVKNYNDASYTDYKLGVSYDLSGYALGVAVVGTDGKDIFKTNNTLVNVNGKGETKKLYETNLVLSIGKTF